MNYLLQHHIYEQIGYYQPPETFLMLISPPYSPEITSVLTSHITDSFS